MNSLVPDKLRVSIDHEHTHDYSHSHHHAHHSMPDVESIIKGFDGLSEDVRNKVIDVYKIVAGAESAVHGTTVSEIQFHEVGMLDAIIDVTAVSALMDMPGADKVYASPVRTAKVFGIPEDEQAQILQK